MHLGLEGKVVLLTGDTKGFGRTMVRSFLQEGAIVYFCSRTASHVSSTKDRLSAEFKGDQVKGETVDVSKPDQIRQWIDGVAKGSGKIDVVVANVSAISTDDTPEAWQLTFQTDIDGHPNPRPVSAASSGESKGNIVTISSVSGRDIDFTAPGRCSPGNVYIEDGVLGGIERSMPDFFAKQLAANPMGRMGKPDKIADAVLFLGKSVEL